MITSASFHNVEREGLSASSGAYDMSPDEGWLTITVGDCWVTFHSIERVRAARLAQAINEAFAEQPALTAQQAEVIEAVKCG